MMYMKRANFINMDRKHIQKKRKMLDFIAAADQIIEKEGIDGVTIRKVAEIAGYNSATLYNYFENIHHLVLFAAMKYFNEYLENLPTYLDTAKDAYERFTGVWACFFHYSFEEPEIFSSIFFANLEEKLENYVSKYYEMFPIEMGKYPEALHKMLSSNRLGDRAKILLQECVDEGFFQQEDISDINEMILYIYESLLIRTNRGEMDAKEAERKANKFLATMMEGYRGRSSEKDVEGE